MIRYLILVLIAWGAYPRSSPTYQKPSYPRV